MCVCFALCLSLVKDNYFNRHSTHAHSHTHLIKSDDTSDYDLCTNCGNDTARPENTSRLRTLIDICGRSRGAANSTFGMTEVFGDNSGKFNIHAAQSK